MFASEFQPINVEKQNNKSLEKLEQLEVPRPPFGEWIEKFLAEDKPHWVTAIIARISEHSLRQGVALIEKYQDDIKKDRPWPDQGDKHPLVSVILDSAVFRKHTTIVKKLADRIEFLMHKYNDDSYIPRHFVEKVKELELGHGPEEGIDTRTMTVRSLIGEKLLARLNPYLDQVDAYFAQFLTGRTVEFPKPLDTKRQTWQESILTAAETVSRVDIEKPFSHSMFEEERIEKAIADFEKMLQEQFPNHHGYNILSNEYTISEEVIQGKNLQSDLVSTHSFKEILPEGAENVSILQMTTKGVALSYTWDDKHWVWFDNNSYRCSGASMKIVSTENHFVLTGFNDFIQEVMYLDGNEIVLQKDQEPIVKISGEHLLVSWDDQQNHNLFIDGKMYRVEGELEASLALGEHLVIWVRVGVKTIIYDFKDGELLKLDSFEPMSKHVCFEQNGELLFVTEGKGRGQEQLYNPITKEYFSSEPETTLVIGSAFQRKHSMYRVFDVHGSKVAVDMYTFHGFLEKIVVLDEGYERQLNPIWSENFNYKYLYFQEGALEVRGKYELELAKQTYVAKQVKEGDKDFLNNSYLNLSNKKVEVIQYPDGSNNFSGESYRLVIDGEEHSPIFGSKLNMLVVTPNGDVCEIRVTPNGARYDLYVNYELIVSGESKITFCGIHSGLPLFWHQYAGWSDFYLAGELYHQTYTTSPEDGLFSDASNRHGDNHGYSNFRVAVGISDLMSKEIEQIVPNGKLTAQKEVPLSELGSYHELINKLLEYRKLLSKIRKVEEARSFFEDESNVDNESNI